LLLLYSLVIVAPLLAWYEWLRPRGVRGALGERGMVAALAGGGAALAVVSLALAIPYLQVRDDHPESIRSEATIKAFSPKPISFVAAPAENVVWGYRTSAARSHVGTRGLFAPSAEKTLLPGLVAFLLALAGLTGPPLRRGLRIGLGVATLLLALLALGLSLGSVSPYRLLYDIAPGWDAIRTPGRVATLLTLTLALLAGAGADRVAPRLRARSALLVPLLPALVLFEGWAPPDVPRVPANPPGVVAAAPLLHVPSNRFVDSRYLLWSTDRFESLVNGWSGFEPRLLQEVRWATRSFPSEPGGRPLLRRLGVRAVVAHRRDGGVRVYPLRR
jgi:hypothetical protein